MSSLSVVYLLDTFFLLAGIIYFGSIRAGYSSIRHTISELGEVGATNQQLVSLGLFLPVGATLLLAGLYTYLVETAAFSYSLAGLSISVGAGYVIAAFFPCDAGSPLSGSSQQQIHNIGGFIEYVGGGYFMHKASQPFSEQAFALAGYIIVGGAILLSFSGLFPWRGLIQRIIEVVLFGSLIVLSLT